MDVDRTWGSTLVKNHDENKTYILVKLSESFSNAIQEYSAPKIKFHGSRGAIRFPNGKSYDFSLEQSDNPVECIRQSKNKWETVGKVACCLHVKGKDDVYQRTRTKMEAAEQEKRKYCAKLLGSPEHESTTTTSTRTTAITATAHSNSSTSYPATHNSIHNSNFNSHSSNRSSKFSDASVNNKSSSLFNNLSSSSSLASAQALAAPIAPNAASDLKSSLLSSLSTGSASSSSSSASSSSAAPATSATTSNNNHVNLSKYPDIVDVEQMHRYKADFDKDFKEYQHLHGYLHKIEEKFRKLKETLKRSVEGSSEWESAKEEIFNEYDRFKGDSNFHRARSKYLQLDTKLNHIQKKIFQFKQVHRDKGNNKRSSRDKCNKKKRKR